MSNNTLSHWCMSATDSWFFRENRDHDAAGVTELGSVFPPPASTVMGAIRTLVGDQTDVNWHEFKEGKNEQWQLLLGDADQLGTLQLSQLNLLYKQQPLWPCPASLLAAINADGKQQFSRLHVGSPVDCDLGRVALPELPATAPAGSKTLNQSWLTTEGAQRWLKGEVPDAEQVIHRSDLLVEESRLGIGRNNHTATTQQGLLYQTRHLRLKDDVALGVTLQGLPDTVRQQLEARPTLLRLGAEGRTAHLTQQAQPVNLPPQTQCQQGDGVLLWLISPMALPTGAEAMLPGFVAKEHNGIKCWEGKLQGIGLRVISACMDRPLREGGWDQRGNQPKPIRNYLAPGTVFFCEITGPQTAEQALAQLHGSQAGPDAEWARGRLLAGRWPKAEQRHFSR